MAQRMHVRAIMPISAARLPATHTRPRLRLIAAMNERRDTPTIEAPPPSSEPSGDRPTQPPESPETMLPAARTPSDFKEVAANDVIAGQRQLQSSLDELLGPGGRLEMQTAAIAAIVDNAAKRQIQSYDLLRQDVMRRFDLVDARDRDQDAKLAAVTSELAGVKAEIVQLRDRLDTQQRDLQATNDILDELEKRWAKEHPEPAGG